MDIPASLVMQLRDQTGVSMMACKKALIEANGDLEAAVDILRKSGEAKAASKADRVANEGGVFIASAGSKIAVAVLKCETDFVARSDDFSTVGKKIAQIALDKGAEAARTEATTLLQEAILKVGENLGLGSVETLEGATWGYYVHSNAKVAGIVSLEGGTEEQAKDVAMHGVATNPKYVSPTEVSADDIAHEREIAKAQLVAENKPEAMHDKILEGKMKKFAEENALLTQPFVKDPSMTVEKYLGGAKVTTFMRIAV